MGWTKEQQKAIGTRNKNLLVSAAAGSGKTAVLVERIISMISEGEHPLDIDRLLVVTFTNAAAAEMRERIGQALDTILSPNSESGEDDKDKQTISAQQSEHLQKQISLLQSTQITTIHSFCLNVLRNYFHRIDLDPSFKIAEEAEMTLMKSDVVSEILERWYEEGREDFLDFIECYSYSKSDAPIEDLILRLYHFSMSAPWPKAWIAEKRKMFDLKSMEEMNHSPWMADLLSYISATVEDLLVKISDAIAICNGAGGPTAYLPALLSDRDNLQALKAAKSYEEYARLIAEVAFVRLSSKREDGVNPRNKDRVKALRDEVKKGIKDLTNQFFFQSPEEMLKDMQSVNKSMQVLFDLTLEFMEEFAKKKEEKNLVDFNDLEHLALKILVREKEEPGEDGTTKIIYEPTEAARELSEQFEEILIDEYQDSNMVQETILQSISRENIGSPNRFMVGDVKQSIYKFRLAMPEIFMKKYETYSTKDATDEGKANLYQRIDLDKNFRSRRTVLEYVNQIFRQIMIKQVGGVVYDEAAELKYGGTYDNLPCPEDGRKQESNISLAEQVDLLMVTDEEIPEVDDKDSKEEGYDPQESKVTDPAAQGENDTDEEDYTKKEMEALAIAKKIKEITTQATGMKIYDKKKKCMRQAEYRDIAILLRSMANWSEVFVNTLMTEGIPAYADTGTGYFQTLEVMTVLNMLKIIDNPRQDIPFTGVLYSPMVGLTSTELAMIRTALRNTGMYSAAVYYAQEGSDEGLRNKLADFLRKLDTYRSMVNHRPIHEIIQLVLDQTGYYYYISAMPGGERRKANLDMLISQAVRFEKGSYSGLFHFIRYIEKLHKYEVDFGEASTTGEQDNTVRIMSIHKSKGLEFPIVIVAGMGKQFNMQDTRSNILLHSEMGVGPDYVDSKLRTKVPTLLKKAIQKKVQTENLGEELRVLYVAMTRARDKLIMTGYLKSLEELKRKSFTFYELLSSKSYLDLVLPAMHNVMGEKPVIDKLPYHWGTGLMSISIIHRKGLMKQEMEKQLIMHKDREELEQITHDQVYDSDLREEIKSRINYKYPYAETAALKFKMTVSELKKLGQFQDEEQSVILYGNEPERNLAKTREGRQESKPSGDSPASYRTVPDQETTSVVPDFISRKDTQISGTDRGTLYHKVLELLDLTKVSTREDLVRELKKMTDGKQISGEDVKKLKQDYIFNFAISGIADRMRRAQLKNKLYKEKQFVIGMEASEVFPGTESDEMILIQGIIDAYFEEEDGLVLVDYKSDIVTQAEQLIMRYKTQLDYYRKALEQMLHRKVKEMIIYSLPLAKEIHLEE